MKLSDNVINKLQFYKWMFNNKNQNIRYGHLGIFTSNTQPKRIHTDSKHNHTVNIKAH